MTQQTLFISDLHLDPAQPHITTLFLDFLTHQATKADALYILGDLFEAWIGDDHDTEFNHQIKTALKNLATQVPIYLMVGNRDFLLGDRFAHESGCQLLRDPTMLDLYGTATLLMHGDSLCSDDKRHQLFRRFSQHPLVRQISLSVPLKMRQFIADKIRMTSKQRTGLMPAYSMDVNQKAVEKVMQQQGVLQLIHGHTHQPDIHEFKMGNYNAKRIVLGAWHKKGYVLVCQPNQEPYLFTF